MTRYRLLLGCLLAVVAAVPARAYVYWSSTNSNMASAARIGRANLDGTGVNDDFVTIPPAADGTLGGCGMSVTSTNVYWANCNGGTGTTIGRANLDGTGIDNNFISGANNPCGVTAFGPQIYWDGDNPDRLGRANLDGSGVNQNFLAPGGAACGVAVNSSFIYFSNYRTGTIGRANIDGSGQNNSFITGVPGATGIAIDGSHIYWGDSGGTIGRANLDGTGVNENFITAPAGAINASQVAVDASHVYWANYQSNTIGRANLDGTGVNFDFVTTSGSLYGLAVDGLSPPVAGKNVNAQAVSGVVLVRLPGRSGFKRLTATQQIPLGSTIDSTSGVVNLTAAKDRRGHTEAGQFYGGEFRTTQRRLRGSELTVLALRGPKPTGCRAAGTARKKPRKSLWGSSRGGYQTVGSFASATERGTKWLTEDTCAGTLVKVTQGSVVLHDFPHHRTIVLKAPRSFLAHPGPGG